MVAICKPTTTEPQSQQEQIHHALATAIDHGWVEWEFLEDSLSPEDEWAALSLLAPYRAKLKKLGVAFPTKAQYQDRLEVAADGDGWAVSNLTKGTQYTVTLAGLRLDCSCDIFGVGWCKHREAVEAWRDVHGGVGPFGIPDDDINDAEVGDHESEKRWQEAEFELAQLDMLWELEEVNGAEYRRRYDAWTAYAEGTGPHPDEAPPTLTAYDFTPYWVAPFPPSAEQSAALQALGHWYDSLDPIFRLTGSAGTGKSTAIQSFIKYMRGLPTPPRIAVAASINKAVKVQQKILREWGLDDIPTHTCAQLFGVRRKVVEGEEIFTPDPNAYEYYKDYDVIIIDEASTLGEQEWGMVLDATHDGLFSARFIIMGDPAQLPPINEGESMALRYPCPSAHLSTVQRYDGSIAVMADEVRNNLGRLEFPEFVTDVDPDTKKGIYAVDRATWEAMIRKVFTGEAYRDNPDFAKILAYTNKRVEALNVLVRNATGYRAPWVVGERIIALKPYMALTTSDEATITGVHEGSSNGVDCWYLSLDNGDTIPVPRRPAEFEAQLKELTKAKQHGKYWALKEAFAAITYAYALTVHRSQGSTYAYAFVDVADFKKCKGQHRTTDGDRILERNQLLYVAATRPSERLIISL
jgi:hypothetical protein